MNGERWKAQCDEWQRIADELIAANPAGPVTAWDVSQEQKKRMWARGERPMTQQEIEQDMHNGSGDFPDGRT